MLTLLKREGMLRGVLGGSQPWTIVWLALFVRDRIKKAKQPDTVYRVDLAPGQALAISHLFEDRRGRVPRKLRKQAHSGV